MDKLFLFDAYALVYRAYFALIRSPRLTSKGLNTSAVYGFVNTLNEIITKEAPTHLAVVFEHGHTFRNEVYPAYKAQRDETPEGITVAVPLIKRILEAMNIAVLEADGYEADDVIGTLATQAAQKGIETYMLTPDKDYGQLVRENVFMFRPRQGGGYDKMGEKEVTEKWGISNPSQVIDLLALMGDTADNFPGCPGVGEKTAAKLINEFGSVDNLLQNTHLLKGKMKEKVENAIDDIKMAKFLATIKTDAPVQLNLDELQLREPNREKLALLFDELEFKTLAKKILKNPKTELKEQNQQLSLFEENTTEDTEIQKTSTLKRLNDTPHQYKLIEKEEDMQKILDFFLTKSLVSFDTETTSTNAITAQLVGLSFSTAPGEAFYVPVPENETEARHIVHIFQPLYENEQIEKVGQNIKYDMEVLARYGVEVKGPLFDTMLAHYVLQPEQRHNMDDMAANLLNYQTIHIEELIGPAGKNQRSMRDLAPEQVYEYACEDADITLQLKNVLQPLLAQNNCEALFYEIEMPLVPVLVDMELTGVRLDTHALAETAETFNQRLLRYEEQIYELAGEHFNISSPKQVGDILFGKMKIVEKPKKTKSGQFVTSEEVLQQLKGKAPVIAHILDYRGLKKLLGTYVEALPKLVNPKTGHLHTSFNQAVTATGRLSSSDPNLQNIPVRDDDGKEIRKCFVPDEGQLFFSADYSQIELRIMAHLSEDPHMCEAFRQGHDIHTATAAKIYKVPLDEVTPEQRKNAKQANFGIIYGITAYGLSQRMNIPPKEAQQLIDDYFTTFPKVRQYMEQAKETARQKGYAETMFQRRRYLPDINSQNATIRNFAERNAINAPIQGSEADIIKVAMIRIHRRFKEERLRSKMILQVHDELNFSVLPEEKDKVQRIVIEEMENAYPLSIPLLAEGGWGANWLEAH